jgi:hypothetical protein
MIWNTSKALVNWRGWKLRSESLHELRSESLHESFLNFHAPVKREQELHESWEARVCMRVFSTLMPWSNENKSCTRVEKREFAWEFSQLSWPGQTRTRVAWELRSESVWEFSQLSCPGQTRTRVAWELMRVEKREFAWEFSQLSCPGQTRTRVACELMRVEKREFAWDWEFSQLSCPGQTRTRVAWELMRVEKREFAWEFSQLSCPGQTRTRVAWELRSESLHESFLNSHAPSNENKSYMRVDWILPIVVKTLVNSYQNLNQLKLD